MSLKILEKKNERVANNKILHIIQINNYVRTVTHIRGMKFGIILLVLVNSLIVTNN